MFTDFMEIFVGQIKLYLKIHDLNVDYSIIADKTRVMVYGINTEVSSYPEKICWTDRVRNVVAVVVVVVV